MLTGILVLLASCTLIFAFAGMALKLIYVLIVGVPLGVLLLLLGLVLCLTIIGLPLGLACFRMAGKIFYPF